MFSTHIYHVLSILIEVSKPDVYLKDRNVLILQQQTLNFGNYFCLEKLNDIFMFSTIFITFFLI